MSFLGFALLLVAAVFHAGWNLLLKQAGEKYLVLWWALVVGAICTLPLLLMDLSLPLWVLPVVLVSAIFEAAYYGTLAAAYRVEDFSLVYPVARGAAPALLVAWSVLFLKETPSSAGWVGLVILVLGLMVVGSSRWWTERRGGPAGWTGLGLACLVALFISIYSAIDGAAVKSVHPIPYTVLVFAFSAILVTPIMVRQYGWGTMWGEWRAHWRPIVGIGILTTLAYMLVMVVYSFSPVAYAGSLREISIVFGAIAGWLWLKEGFGPIRALGAGIIFVGMLVIMLAG